MPSFGEELRRERELREISLREISEATKVSVRYLEALERNDFSDLPEGVVFRRGYVRAYCQHIGLDPEAMVNAYLLEEQAQRSDSGVADGGLLRGRADRGGIATHVDAPEPGVDGRAVRLVVTIAAVGLIVVVALVWWWLSRGAL